MSRVIAVITLERFFMQVLGLNVTFQATGPPEDLSAILANVLLSSGESLVAFC